MNRWENQNNKLSKAKKPSFALDTILVFFGDYDCGNLFLSPEGDEKVLTLPLLDDDEEKYYSVSSLALTKGVKILTSNKLLTPLTTLLSQIEPGSKSQ